MFARVIVDNDDLSSIRQDTNPAHKKAILIDGIDNSVAIRSHHNHDIFVAMPFQVHVSCAVAESVCFIMPNNSLLTFAYNGAVRFANYRPIAFDGLMALAVQLVHPVQWLPVA